MYCVPYYNSVCYYNSDYGVADHENWHGKPFGDKAGSIVKNIEERIAGNVPAPIAESPVEDAPVVSIKNIRLSSVPAYKKGETVATRVAYGTALMKLAQKNSRVIGLDGDTKNSTYSEKIKKVSTDNYIECYIAEQNLVGFAIGAACRDRNVAFRSTFAAFFTRAFDQIRKDAMSQANINCVGSHAGVSIGEDGPSQMALEYLAMFRTIPVCTVFYPSDAVSCERACELAANTRGICFIRTSRPATVVIYNNEALFQVGKAKVVRENPGDKVVLIGVGITMNVILLLCYIYN
ncbi:transketolase-like protein 2 [Artemia franciscana]|uniref:transketolase-like protein 2 n=1 Tax=Artemia franciscana TaxID=6661 RepID=UPI0032DB5B03